MPPPVEPARVELGQLRELLADDRKHIGDLRKAQKTPSSLATVDYAMPLRVQWRRAWRADPRLRLAAWSACLCVVAAVVLWQAPLWNAPPARAASHSKPNTTTQQPRAKTTVTVTGTGTGAATGTGSATVTGSVTATGSATVTGPATGTETPSPVSLPAESASPEQLSPRMRLVRADAWLKHDSQRAAREARALLESALAVLPSDAHGHASLAEACLRLEDSACAHDAITRALHYRPLRSRYNALKQTIDGHFAPAAR